MLEDPIEEEKDMSQRIVTLVSVVVVASLILAGCAQPAPTPQTIVQTGPPEIRTAVVTAPPQQIVVTATPAPAEVTYARNETLYTSGTQWGPPNNWNPLVTWGYAMGTLGLCYETLFLYDPLTDEYIPWLAESGKWVDPKTYELKLRQGITWSDGQPFTAKDVKFTFELGKKFAAVYYSTMWRWLASVDQVDDFTLRFPFGEPLYQEWANALYTMAMLPEHLWKDRTEEEVATGANEHPVGTGPYLYETHAEDRMVWVRNDNWWATRLLGYKVAPKRIVDIVNSSNNVALGLLLHGDLGVSLWLFPKPVIRVILDAVPYDILLLLPAILLSWFAGNNFGAIAARRRWLDNTVSPLSYILTATPYMWLAILLAWALGIVAGIFPISGAYSYALRPHLSWAFIGSLLQHWFLPFASLFLVMFGGWAIGMRNMIIYELEADYSRYLEALGAPRGLIRKYAFRNAVLPQITGLALELSKIVAGALATEVVFSYPGIGYLILQAIQNKDYFLLQGCFLFIIIGVLLANFAIDIVYVGVDPRTRVGMQGEMA